MAGAGAAALLPALTGLATGTVNAFANQGRSPLATAARRTDTSSAALASATDPKIAKRVQKNAERERLLELLTDPQVMGLLTVLGGLALSTRIPFHPDPATNARIQGIAAASCVLMGLGRAGVGDMTTLTVAAGAGMAVASGSGGLNIPGTEIPVYALSPGGATAWGIQELLRRGLG